MLFHYSLFVSVDLMTFILKNKIDVEKCFFYLNLLFCNHVVYLYVV